MATDNILIFLTGVTMLHCRDPQQGVHLRTLEAGNTCDSNVRAPMAETGYNSGMKIHLSKDLEESCRSSGGFMTVEAFLARFPEVPRDLANEPIIAEYVDAFGPQLRVAQKPSPCVGAGGDAPHFFYTRLINDLAIYGIGLAKRDRTLARLQGTLAEYRKQPATFACTLVPHKPKGSPRAGCA